MSVIRWIDTYFFSMADRTGSNPADIDRFHSYTFEKIKNNKILTFIFLCVLTCVWRNQQCEEKCGELSFYTSARGGVGLRPSFFRIFSRIFLDSAFYLIFRKALFFRNLIYKRLNFNIINNLYKKSAFRYFLKRNHLQSYQLYCSNKSPKSVF